MQLLGNYKESLSSRMDYKTGGVKIVRVFRAISLKIWWAGYLKVDLIPSVLTRNLAPGYNFQS
jgi:hypothetical protein